MPRMRLPAICFVALLAACGSGGDTPNPPGDSNTTGDDAPPPPPPPGKIAISGTAAEQAQGGATPVDGASIEVFKVSDEATPIATATSDAQGMYSIQIDDSDKDIFVKASKSGFKDTYAYPPGVLTESTVTIDANMLTDNTYGQLLFFIGGSSSKGMITLVVLTASDQPVQGATVQSTPVAGKVRYMSGGFPSGQTATDTDGLAFLVDVPVGTVTVNAMKSGSTFKSHPLKARAESFTTSLVTE